MSKCNYLVLSISLTALGQRALCWWGQQCVNSRLDIFGLFRSCGHSICHPHIALDLITLNKPERLKGRGRKKPDANGLCIVCKSSLISLLSVLRDWSRALRMEERSLSTMPSAGAVLRTERDRAHMVAQIHDKVSQTRLHFVTKKYTIKANDLTLGRN